MKLHQVAPYIMNPNHPITITIIGCGGNGSLMLSRLARTDYALQQSNKTPLNVTVYDDDIVEPFNIGRQMFGYGDVGEFKSTAIVSKINRNFCVNYKAIPRKFDVQKDFDTQKSNIYITCVDNAQFRVDFNKKFKEYQHGEFTQDYEKTFYWIDLGNAKNVGQGIISSTKIEQPTSEKITFVDRLPTIIDRFPNLIALDTKEIQGNGCSYADKLEEQNLFINDAITSTMSHCIWNMLVKGIIDNAGFFTNLNTLKTNSIPL